MTTRPAIAMYHSVDTMADPLLIQVTPARLAQQFQVLRRLGFRGVSVSELLSASDTHERLIGLTFDDGYADFATTAAPILAEFGFSATVFVVAGKLAGTNDWDPPPRRPLMTGEQLQMIEDAGHEIGSHGMHHVRLVGQSPEGLTVELRESRLALDSWVKHPVRGFCYPHGNFSAETAAAVQNEYDYACVVTAGLPRNQWTLPRFHVGDSDGPLRLVSKLALRPAREMLQRRAS